jgi:hypothetical protein
MLKYGPQPSIEEEPRMGSKDKGGREKKKPKKSKDLVAPTKSRYDRTPPRPAAPAPVTTPTPGQS